MPASCQDRTAEVAGDFWFSRTGKTGGLYPSGMVHSVGLRPAIGIYNAFDTGFILISVTGMHPEILGYSTECLFDPALIPPAMSVLLEAYADLITTRQERDKVLDLEKVRESGNHGPESWRVGPLLATYWAQSCYYNDSCPADTAGYCGHARAGCGATAMGQIMKYHNHPASGYGGHEYDHPMYGTLGANFGATYYAWQDMPDVLNSSSPPASVAAVAQILFHCGVAVEMDYGPLASYSGTTSIRDAFVKYFRYSSEGQLLNISQFPDTIWSEMLRAEIDAGRPVFYGISSGTGGHFTVLDGYEGEYFHFNWGNAVQAGYFKLLSELPVVQEAIIRLMPLPGSCDSVALFLARDCMIDDGSGPYPYPSLQHCIYMIATPGSQFISLVFGNFSTQSGADYLYIFDGSSPFSPLLGKFSGNNPPPPVISNSSSLTLEFITDGYITGDGWSAWYSAHSPSDLCNGLTHITDSSGIVEDGSGPGNYLNHQDCFWWIHPADASSLTLSFLEFDTESSADYLSIFDGYSMSTSALLGSFAGNQLPASLSSTTGSVMLHFNTDFSTVRPGWRMEYNASFEKIILNLKIFLEGPFDAGIMRTDLNPADIPHSHPFSGHPWNHFLPASVAAVPSPGVVDWILLEIRETPYGADSATSKTCTGRKPAFLMSDGSVRDLNGADLSYFSTEISQNLFVVVWHRNHLGIMSSQPLPVSGGIYSYDFSTSAVQVYGGMTGYRELAPGLWGMVSSDGNADGQINQADKQDVWTVEAGLSGYRAADFNMDGMVNNEDKIEYWAVNSGMGSQWPDQTGLRAAVPD